jgi:hypothetical protein
MKMKHTFDTLGYFKEGDKVYVGVIIWCRHHGRQKVVTVDGFKAFLACGCFRERSFLKPPFTQFGAWLQLELEKRSMEINTFSKLCGISRSQIYRYQIDSRLRGRRPSLNALEQICVALNVPLEHALREFKYNGKRKRETPRAYERYGRSTEI